MALPMMNAAAGTRTNFMPRLFSMTTGPISFVDGGEDLYRSAPLQADSEASARQARLCNTALAVEDFRNDRERLMAQIGSQTTLSHNCRLQRTEWLHEQIIRRCRT